MARADAARILAEVSPPLRDYDIDWVLDTLHECNEEAPLDAESTAHLLWTMGLILAHEGCRYGGEDANDGDYENDCRPCRAYLESVAARLLAVL